MKGEADLARRLGAQKETTGRIISRPPSEAYAEGWDRVFGSRERPTMDGLRFIRSHPSEMTDAWYCTGCRGAVPYVQGKFPSCPKCDGAE